MAANDGIGNPVRDPFPGIRLPDGTGAPGSGGARGDAADDAATMVTPMTGAHQDRYSGHAGTVEPGQSEPTAINPNQGTGSYTDTGAGQGSGQHYPRRPWQQGAR
jgi:hypothetical protein